MKRDCNRSVKMVFNKEIEGLHDDGFEGSMEEHRIFTEVFFGNDSGRSGKRCLVTGVINFEGDYSKHTGVSICSNSESSAIKSQEDSRGNSGPGCLSEELTLLTRNAPDVNVKRMKLSVDKLSNAKPCLEKDLNSSAPLKGVVPGMSQPTSHFVRHTVTCRLVESSSQRVTSSCYLLKRPIEMDRGGDRGDRNVSRRILSSFDGSGQKEIVASKPIASPVSQESYATKLLVASPSVTVTNKSEPRRCAKPRWKESCFVELDIAELSMPSDSKTDPRRLLRYHIFRLLRAAGWVIGRRKRDNLINGTGEFVYRSPERRPIREFHRAWNLCGQSLFAAANDVIQESDGKQWTDLTQFWSDLSNTLTEIEEQLDNLEPTTALAYYWYLLDPFASVVFIDKTISSLKAGKVVKAKRSPVIDLYAKCDAVMALKNVDRIRNQFTERHCTVHPCGSSLASDSALTVFKEDYRSRCGGGGSENFGQLEGEAVKALKIVSSYSSEEKSVLPIDTISVTDTKYRDDQTGTCLFEVPIYSGNADISIGGSETVSRHEDSNTGSPSYDKYISNCSGEMPLRVIKGASMGFSEEEGRTFRRKVSDRMGNLLQGSVDDHSNCTNGVFAESYDSGKTFLELTTCVSASELCRPSLVEDSYLVDTHSAEAMLHPVHIEMEGIEAPKHRMDGAYFSADGVFRSNTNKKSKKKAEIKLTTLYQNDELGQSSSYKTGQHDIGENSIQVESRRVQDCFVANIRNDRSCKKSSLCSSQHRKKKQLRFKKFHHNSGSSKNLVQVNYASKHPKEIVFENSADDVPLHHCTKSKKSETQVANGQQKSTTCHLKDDDLLISAIIKNKSFTSTTVQYSVKRKSCKSKALRKRKSQKGSCMLLPRSLNKGGKHYMEGKWSAFGSRTVLSLLTSSGVVSLNEVIQYRNPKNDAVVKDGLVTRDGILCRCCDKVHSVSDFKSHAGFRLNRPCLNLFMESGKPFTLCQLEAWSAEYKARKSPTRNVQIEEMDQNDDSCGLCGDGGELICCDNCPSTFHQACLYAKELPEGSWYCRHCTCWICGDVVDDKEASQSPCALKCSQCERKYHEACLKEKGINKGVVSDAWFCGESCREVYSGLHSRIGLMNLISDGFSWTLLRCIHGDQKVHSAQRIVALKAECNVKLVVSLTIMEECFVPMVDLRTGIDMIPHLLYNWGSQFARLNYQGFYTVVLEKDDVLMSVASIRIHGVTVAEMPLIATCSKYRRQGMCRRLMNAILEMLKSFKVKKLVISAIPSLVETWTAGFGFKPLEDDERQSLSNINLMVFPGTIWLKKPLCEQDSQEAVQQTGSCHASPSGSDDQTKTSTCSEGGPIVLPSQPPDRNLCIKEVDAVTDIRIANCKILQVGEDKDGDLHKHLLMIPCEESDSTLGVNQVEIVCNEESVKCMMTDKFPLTKQSQKTNVLEGYEK